MGYMTHHAIIVTSWKRQAIDAAYELAESTFGQLVTPIVEGVVNEQYTFMVGPDGSKEGWDISDDHDELRSGFVARLKALHDEQLWLDWAEVQFGGDQPDINTQVLDHNGLYAAEWLAAENV